ncbi:MAG: tRNA guanosine(34) transglycosylase Tgt [Alphaproteobacteria bacterium]
MTNFFEVSKQSLSSKARLGSINTVHGEVKTPSFIFCGTKATVKSILPHQLRSAKTQIILSNTYHLMLQPGPDIISKEKGLQNFTQWRGPMMTDSGGYQIFSLGHGSVSEEIKGKNKNIKRKSLIKISEEGAIFRNYLNGDKVYLTPERSIELQRHFGADLIFVLDECTPFNVSKKYTENSMYLSHRWAKRCSDAFKNTYSNFDSQSGSSGRQHLFGIIQGGVYEDLRKIACEETCSGDYNGLAIGGSLGGSKEQMHDIFSFCSDLIDKSKPVHVLGIGGLDDILHGVSCGYDTFDCVSPTRIARHGIMLSRLSTKGINLNNSKFKNDHSFIDEECELPEINNFSKSYLHHLFKANEILGIVILSLYNIWFMNKFFEEIRVNIQNDTFEIFKKNFLNNLTK